jgi:hypothetical protein
MDTLVRHDDHIQLPINFGGLRWGNITPTDIDAFIDFNDKLFVLVETKFGNSPMFYGQQLALERLCDACNSPERRAALFVTSHPKCDIIDLAETTVTKYRWAGKWHTPNDPHLTLLECVESLYERHIMESEPIAA